MPPIRSHPRPRPSAVPVAVEEITSRLDTLAAELEKRRWTAHVTAEPWRAHVTAEPWRRPRLFVRHPTNPALCGHYQAAPDDFTGAWLFWDDAGTPITLTSAPRAAADVIVQTLGAQPE